jgi:hypothetical protein
MPDSRTVVTMQVPGPIGLQLLIHSAELWVAGRTELIHNMNGDRIKDYRRRASRVESVWMRCGVALLLGAAVVDDSIHGYGVAGEPRNTP